MSSVIGQGNSVELKMNPNPWFRNKKTNIPNDKKKQSENINESRGNFTSIIILLAIALIIFIMNNFYF